MITFKKYGMWFFILLFALIISGCGIGRPFHGGHHYSNYRDGFYDQTKSGFQNYSHPSGGYFWK